MGEGGPLEKGDDPIETRYNNEGGVAVNIIPQ